MKKLIYSALVLVLTTFTLASCEDVPAPYDLPTDNGGIETPDTPSAEATGDGTLENPYNSVAANAAAAALASGAESETDVYIKGKVVSVKEEYTTSYGNATYYISDDGTSTNQFYVYRALYLGNKKFASGDTQIKEGDEVIVCGRLTNYNGTCETAQNKAYLYSLNGDTGNGGTPDTPSAGEAKGDGTASDPYNCVAANKYVSSLEANVNSTSDIYITGKVVSIKENYGDSSYGNATYYISDDGTETNQFYVFRSLYLNNEKYSSGAKLAVGDEVTVCGKVVNYYGNTPETVGNQSYLYKHNSNGGTNGGDQPTTSDAISISGTAVTLTNTAVTAGTETITVDLSTLGYENAQDMGTITLSDGTTIDFDANGETNGPKYYNATKGARVYKNNIIKFNGKSAIAQVILTCDSYNGTDYVGNATATLGASGNTLTYTNVYTEASGGGVQLRVKTIQIVYAQ